MFILAHQRLLSFELRKKIPCVDDGNDLPGLHHIAFFGEKFEDAAREFRVDVDFLGIGSSVAPDYACWNRGEGGAPPRTRPRQRHRRKREKRIRKAIFLVDPPRAD